MSQFSLCKEVLPPSGISHSCTAFFTHAARRFRGSRPRTPNVVVARSTLLQVYSVRVGNATETVRTVSDVENGKLELVAEMRLAGVVESLAVLRGRAGALQRDALLLTFREAKLVVLDWDGKADAIVVSSLHYFEGDPVLRAGRTVFPLPPRVVADPQGRCAAVVMFKNQVALLPAMGVEALDHLLEERGDKEFSLPATVGNSYMLNLNKMGIKDVRDAVFLHQYNEPVLLLLHEGPPTWAGRYRDRKDTCALTALSINVANRRYPVLWKAEGLPSSATRLLAVPRGGALLFCRELILYHTQGASCGLAVSRAAHPGPPPVRLEIDPMRELPSETAARHARQYATSVHPEAVASAGVHAPYAEGFELDLSDVVACWLSDVTLVLGLATGQLVLVNLLMEGHRVASIRVSKAGVAPPASGMSVIDADLMFLASWVGDSLLLRTIPEGKEKEVLALKAGKGAAREAAGDGREGGDVGTGGPDGAAPDGGSEEGGEGEEPDVKRRRLDTAYSGLGDREEEEDAQLSLIYHLTDPSRVSTAATGFTKFSFKVVDSLLGIAPIRDMVVGSAGPSGSEAKGKESQAQAQLVAACGYQRAGALAVLRRSVHADVITDVPLVGVRGMWAVFYRPEGLDEEEGFDLHAYLLLGTASETKVLEGGEALTELRGKGIDFMLDRPTVLAGNVCRSARIVQVTSALILLLAGTTAVQKLTLTAILGEARPKTRVVAASIADPYVLLLLSDGTAALLLADLADGLTVVEDAADELQRAVRGGGEDEDGKITAAALHVDPHGWLAGTHGLSSGPSLFMVVCRGGSMALFALPGPNLVGTYRGVPDGPSVLAPEEDTDDLGLQPGRGTGVRTPASVLEVRLENFSETSGDAGGLVGERPVLVLLLSDGVLLVYRAFRPLGGRPRFARQHLDWAEHLPVNLPAPDKTSMPSSRLVRFGKLGHAPLLYSGIFVCGERPLWLVVWRGALVPHPHDASGIVLAFTPFNNINCPQGFIAGTDAGIIRVCQLAAQVHLDTPWPMQRVPLRSSPHAITFYPEAGLYAVLTSRPVPYKAWLEEEPGGDPQATYAYTAADAGAKKRGVYEGAEVRLVSPGTWTTVWRYELMPGEAATTVAALHLRNQTTGATEPLVAVGTSFSVGEDYPCTGRILLFRVEREDGPKEGAQAAGDGLKWKAEMIYCREVRGPVSHLDNFRVADLEGVAVVAYGSRLETYAWTGTQLQRTAFYDAPILITSATVIKKFVLLGDVGKGLIFVQATQGGRQLSELGREFDKRDIWSCGFLVSGSRLLMVAGDGGASLRLATYDQEHAETWKGKKLLSLGATHLGYHLTRFARVSIRPPTSATPNWKAQGAVGGSTSGALVALSPLWPNFPAANFVKLQRALALALPQPAALNPVAFRGRHRVVPNALGGGTSWGPAKVPDTVLDFELLSQYMNLPYSAQEAVGQSVGMDRSQVLNGLRDLGRAVAVW